MNTPDPERVNPKKLRPGPIYYESLPRELIDEIKAIYEHVDSYLDMNLEQFEIGFMRDMHPERELAAWSRITAA